MGRSIVAQIAESGLVQAWRKVRANVPMNKRTREDSLGYSVASIDARRDVFLRNVAREMVSMEGFHFSSLTAFPIPKKHGHRVICVPPYADRLVQRAVVDHLSLNDRFRLLNPVSFGFIAGAERTVQKAAELAKSHRKAHGWAYKTDITKFFDRIPRTVLESRLNTECRSKPLRQLLIRALHCEIGEASPGNEALIAQAGIKRGQGLRQGMPLSPILANVLLGPFDRAMVRKKLRVIRYADDLIALADSKEECLKIHEVCVTELAKIGLQVPPIGGANDSKTVIASPELAIEFLGVSLQRQSDGNGYELRIPQDAINSMRDRIQTFDDLAFLSASGINVSTIGVALSNLCEGWLSAYDYCSNSVLVSKAIDIWRTQAIQRLFKKHFGIDASTLDRLKREFLLWDPDATT